MSDARGSFHRSKTVLLVALARLRFLVILGAIGLVIVKWDELTARYEQWTRPAEADAADPDHEYFCPMHPQIVRPDNKEKCPICSMPLSKRTKGEPTDDALPAGVVTRVQLSPYRVVLAGVRTVPVEFQPLAKEIATVGTVEFDERGQRAVAARVKGRIDKLFVNQTGQTVNRGDPLALLYSPDLVVAVQNLLDARTSANTTLEKIARDRLTLWGIDDAEIESIVKAGKPITQLTIRSPISGHVLKKYAREGQYVEEGGPLYDVADLSSVWVQAQLYEDDLAFLPAGAHDPKTGRPADPIRVTATVRSFPGRMFRGTLTFLFPHVDPETRTLTVRFELPNQDHELRPGMSASVTLNLTPRQVAATPVGAKWLTQAGNVLAVPEGCVIDTGRQKLVYRESGPNAYDGVLVELGPRMTGPGGGVYYPVLSGLAAGDKVVAAGSFLIDAETRLNPALGSVYIGGGESRKESALVRPSTPDDQAAVIAGNLAKLSPEDRRLVDEQKTCPILTGTRLGSMGVPVKVILDGRPVFVCCKVCVGDARKDPAETLRTVERLKAGKNP
jgi:RND family efflux transporter MFP subunit